MPPLLHRLIHTGRALLASENVTKVGFIGLGAMGSRQARNLQREGYELVVYDRSISRLEEYEKRDNVEVASSPAAVAQTEGVRVLITMLPACAQVREAYCGKDGILSADGGTKASLLIDCSTISPTTSREIAAAVSEARLHSGAQPFPGCSNRAPAFIDAPVSGGTTGASAATLSFMCGGEKDAVEAATPFLKAMGKKIWHCGGPSTGHAAKVCNNMALAIQMASIAEASAAGRRLGLDPKVLADVFNSSSARCWSSEAYNPVPGVMADVPASKGHKAGFALQHMLKDLHLAREAAGTAGSPAPMTEQALEIYEKVAEVDGTLDFTAIYSLFYDKDH
ncbi:g5934 [Coccomyxa viridis]|uniref:3-hydroxyisobutyrate dehydrogenase n=1 Tax=Coccomyxa viridis TaxID=1274662 RepID=A0ABP1FVG8_9CHLO